MSETRVLASGTRLGLYVVRAPLGAGGMGEVYRARDTKLGRDVALKVLPEAFSKDEERLARFEREARLLASLNHPNIAVIHGLEQSDDVQFLVLELVEGETLAERIARGPIGLDDALPLFRQIAEALEAAHSKGIIHRDLKPANIKITPEGKIKVLDFGLAKSLERDVGEMDLSQSPTLMRDGTQVGVILGTAPYMSPEQARGKLVDKRADLWAFGCVLFEALTGRLAFPGETLSDTIATVLSREPAWERLPATTPVGIRALLRRCLQKDPERRLRDAWDARLEIEEALSDGGGVTPIVTVMAKTGVPWRRVIPWVSFGLMATIAVWLSLRRHPEETPRVVRASIALPRMQVSTRRALDISPDGTRIVYTSGEANERQLYSRLLDQDESTPIPGTEGGEGPFFSPDGEWVGFVAGGQLKKVRLDGVDAVTLADTAVARGGSWGANDTIVFKAELVSGLMKIAASGGAPEVLTRLDSDRQEIIHFWPQVLPNAKAVLFTAGTGGTFNDASIVVQSLATGERRVVAQGSNARYVPTGPTGSRGHLVYARGGTLYAAPFNSDSLEVEGESVPVQVGVRSLPNHHVFALSETGTLVYQPSPRTDRRVVLVDLEGRAEPLALPPGPYFQTRFSPDGRQLALGGADGEDGKIYLYELEPERFSLLFDSFEDMEGTVWDPRLPIWSPDGTRFAITGIAPGTDLGMQIFVVSVDGRSSVEHVVSHPTTLIAIGWSPDGTRLLYNQQDENGTHIWEMPLLDEGPKADPRSLVNISGSAQTVASLSPDGRWIVYSSRESGRSEVYVKLYDGPGGGRQVSTDGGGVPVWAPHGRALYYRNGDQMMAVEITTEPRLTAGRPRLLFEGVYWDFNQLYRTYDLSPDGQRFVMIENPEQSTETQVHIVVNWSEELKRLVPSEN